MGTPEQAFLSINLTPRSQTMPIRPRCPVCQALMRIADDVGGNGPPCPQCGRTEGVSGSGPIRVAADEELLRRDSDSEAFPAATASLLPAVPLPPRDRALRQVHCPHCRLAFHAVPGTVSDCPGCQTAVRVPPAAKLGGVAFNESADFPPPALGSTGSPSATFDAPVPSGSGASPPDFAVGDKRSWTPLGRRHAGYDGGYEVEQLPSGRARWYYVMPGVIFLLFSLFVILLVLGRMILPFLLLVRTEVPFMPAANVEKLLWVGVQSGVGMAVGAVYFLGGVAMIRRRGLTMARVAAVAACIPCLNALVLTPIGIWACTLVFGHNAREDFDA